MRQVVIVFSFLFIGLSSFAQIRKIPVEVTNAFSKQYPNAYDVSYKDNLVNIQVNFVLDSANMMAKYSNDGEWKETEKGIVYDALPAQVKDGFKKSKYAADWKETETAVIYMPGNEVRYRLKVEKNDVQKKYLFFDKNGRLIRDALTI